MSSKPELDDEEAKVLRLNDHRNNPLFGDKFKSKDDERVEANAKLKNGSKSASDVDKEELLIDNYISHLNFNINWGNYNDFLDAKEVIKMAQIKNCINVSKHPRLPELVALYDKLVKND